MLKAICNVCGGTVNWCSCTGHKLAETTTIVTSQDKEIEHLKREQAELRKELEEWKAVASDHVYSYVAGWRGGYLDYGDFIPTTEFFPTAKEALEEYNKQKEKENA